MTPTEYKCALTVVPRDALSCMRTQRSYLAAALRDEVLHGPLDVFDRTGPVEIIHVVSGGLVVGGDLPSVEVRHEHGEIAALVDVLRLLLDLQHV